MPNCETNGHIYRQFSTKCVMCGEEGTDFEKCSPPCEYYDSGSCRCAQMEGPLPTQSTSAQHQGERIERDA